MLLTEISIILGLVLLGATTAVVFHTWTRVRARWLKRRARRARQQQVPRRDAHYEEYEMRPRAHAVRGKVIKNSSVTRIMYTNPNLTSRE